MLFADALAIEVSAGAVALLGGVLGVRHAAQGAVHAVSLRRSKVG